MNKIYALLKPVIFLLIPCFLTSCKKQILVIPASPSNSIELFDAFWNKMNINYVYWDIDTTNWDKAYNNYKPKFAQLDLKKSNDLIQSVQYFQEITKGLIDGHYNISFLNSAIANYSVFPSLAKKQKRQDFHLPYYYYQIDSNYLDKDYQIGTSYSDSNNPLTVLCGTIENRILFFSCTEFELYKLYHSNTKNDVQTTLQYFFNKLTNLPDNINGIIIDVRGNQGGDLGDLNFFVGHFIESPLHFGYTQTKSGNGRLDYTPWIKAYVNPEPEGKEVSVPIIVLADMSSASLSEAVVMAFKTLPKSLFIGETTWGATGPIAEQDVYNDGQFKIESFLKVTAASCKFKYLDGKIYEGIGFSPDIFVPFNSIAISNREDTQLEEAISLIH